MTAKPLVQWILVLVVLAAGGGTARYFIRNRHEPEREARPDNRPLVRIQTLVPEAYDARVHSQGTVRPRTSSALVPEVAGRIVKVAESWADGGFFEKDDVLVEIDPSDYELALVIADEQVSRAALRLAQEKQEAAVAIDEWNSMRTDGREPPDLVARVPQLAEAEASLAAAEARRKQAKNALDRTKVRARYAGRILETSVDVGQYVTPGAPIARLYAVDYAEVRLPIPDYEIAFLSLRLDYRGDDDGDPTGPSVILRSDFAGREHEWTAQIVRTEGEIDPRTRMVHAIARVENPYARGDDPDRPPLSTGLFVRAEITGRRFDDVFILARHAIRGDGLVPIVDAENRLRMRTADVLRYDGDRAILRPAPTGSTDPPPDSTSPPTLRAGDRVCISPLTVITDGMGVRVLDGESDESSSASSPTTVDGTASPPGATSDRSPVTPPADAGAGSAAPPADSSSAPAAAGDAEARS